MPTAPGDPGRDVTLTVVEVFKKDSGYAIDLELQPAGKAVQTWDQGQCRSSVTFFSAAVRKLHLACFSHNPY